MPTPLFSGSAVLTNNFKASTAAVIEHFARTITATGEDIAAATRTGMRPNHFLDTSLSQQTTLWEQWSRFSGAIHIPTDYSLWPEVGTARMAPRPVLIPAVMLCFPNKLYDHWAEGSLPPLGPFNRIGPVSLA